jgi:hypothetical protein
MALALNINFEQWISSLPASLQTLGESVGRQLLAAFNSPDEFRAWIDLFSRNTDEALLALNNRLDDNQFAAAGAVLAEADADVTDAAKAKRDAFIAAIRASLMGFATIIGSLLALV